MKRLMMVMGLGLAMSATAAAEPSGATVVSVSQQTRVCMASGAPAAGTPVRITRKQCAPLDAKRTSVTHCREQEVARGQVLRADGPRCAIVELPAGTRVEPGDGLVAAPVSAAR